MSVPPTYFFRDLGPETQRMSKNCDNQRVAMILEYVAVGSMIVMTGLAATQILKETFGSPERDRGRGR